MGNSSNFRGTCRDSEGSIIWNEKAMEKTIIDSTVYIVTKKKVKRYTKKKVNQKRFERLEPSTQVINPGDSIRLEINGVKTPVLGSNDVDWKISYLGFEPPWAWWRSSWSERRQISIAYNQQTSLTDYPAYLKIPLEASMQSDLDDLRFILGSCETGTQSLNYEIEDIDASYAHVWVRIPQLNPGTNEICMYYGNPDATSGENPEAVWNTNYKLVHHMQTDNPQQILDSTSYSNDNNDHNGDPVTTNGKIAGAIEYDGNDDHRIPHDSSYGLSGTNQITLSLWTKPYNIAKGAPWQKIMRKGNNYISYEISSPPDSSNIRFFIYGVNSLDTPVVDNTYQFVTGTYDGSSMKLYLDGVEQASTSASGAIAISSEPLVISNRYGKSEYYQGEVDEVRIMSTPVSADWVKQDYDMMANQEAVVSFGGVENEDTPPVINSFSADPQTDRSGTLVDISLDAQPTHYSLDKCWMTYQKQGESETLGAQSNAITGLNTLTWPTYGLVGDYTLRAYLNDTGQHQATAANTITYTAYTTTTTTTSTTTTLQQPGLNQNDAVLQSLSYGIQIKPENSQLYLDVSGITMKRPDGQLVCCGPDNTNQWTCTTGICN